MSERVVRWLVGGVVYGQKIQQPVGYEDLPVDRYDPCLRRPAEEILLVARGDETQAPYVPMLEIKRI